MAKIGTYAIDSTPNLSDKLIGTDVDNMNATKNFTIGQILSLANLGTYVPYTGANANVNLGSFTLTANSIIKSGGTSSQFLKADGSVDSTLYAPISSLSGYVPYTGATGGVDLGIHTIRANSFVKQGGTASQFLKADGSVDSTVYATAASVSAITFYYGSFYDTLQQTAAAVLTAYPIKFNSVNSSATNGVAVFNDGSGNPTLIKPSFAGVYNISLSTFAQNVGPISESIYLFIRKNGVNVPWTTKIKGVQANSAIESTVSFSISCNALDEIQLMWATGSTDIKLTFAGGTPFCPEVASASVIINKVS